MPADTPVFFLLMLGWVPSDRDGKRFPNPSEPSLPHGHDKMLVAVASSKQPHGHP